MSKQQEKEFSLVREIFSWILTVTIALGLFFIIQTYVGKIVTISGNSMYPTLQNGDRMIMSRLSHIDRYDILVVDAPDSKDQYIKRVIGMPGDRIEIKEGTLYINDKSVEEPYINHDSTQPITVMIQDFTLEELTGEKVVPEDQYFVMGDNRGVSKDSRMIGFIPKSSVEGEAVYTIWPLGKNGRVGKPTDYSYLYSE